jgi:hypothetical protein
MAPILAFLTHGPALGEPNSLVMKEFEDRIDDTFASAEGTEGFLARVAKHVDGSHGLQGPFSTELENQAVIWVGRDDVVAPFFLKYPDVPTTFSSGIALNRTAPLHTKGFTLRH